MNALSRFVVIRFLAATFLVSVGLTCLSLTIEFFEKLYRVAGISFAALFKYLGWYFFPILFQNIPVALWLASSIVIYDFWRSETWFFLRSVAFLPSALRRLFFILSSGIMLIVFLAAELFVSECADKAEYVRLKYFKHKDTSQLYNIWFELAHGGVAHVGIFDKKTSTGKDFLQVLLAESGELKQIDTASHFSFDSSRALIQSENFVHYKQDSDQITTSNIAVYLPELYERLKEGKKHQTLTVLFSRLFFSTFSHSEGFLLYLLRLFAQQLIFLISLPLIPLFTLEFFMLFEKSKYRLISLAIAYPALYLLLESIVFILGKIMT